MSLLSILLMIRISSSVLIIPYLILLETLLNLLICWNLAVTYSSFDAFYCLNQIVLTIAVLGRLNVMQDMVGDILPGGIRQEVIIWLQSIVAILLHIFMNVRLVIPSSSIALMCMSNVILHSQTIGSRDFSDVWVVKLMSYVNAKKCHSSLPTLGVR
jgi:hypothetical protein